MHFKQCIARTQELIICRHLLGIFIMLPGMQQKRKRAAKFLIFSTFVHHSPRAFKDGGDIEERFA